MEEVRRFTVRQTQDVVHARLLELAETIRQEMRPIAEGDRIGQLIGVTGDVGVRIDDDGPSGIDLTTTNGRIRFGVAARMRAAAEPTATEVAARVTVKPNGLVGNVMLSTAQRTRPDLERQLSTSMDRAVSELIPLLELPDDEWRDGDWRERDWLASLNVVL